MSSIHLDTIGLVVRMSPNGPSLSVVIHCCSAQDLTVFAGWATLGKDAFPRRHSGQVQRKLHADPETRFISRRRRGLSYRYREKCSLRSRRSLDSRSAFGIASLVWNDGRETSHSPSSPRANKVRPGAGEPGWSGAAFLLNRYPGLPFRRQDRDPVPRVAGN